MNHKKYLSKIGRKGGRAKSAAKTIAVRLNGKLGGRPKKLIVDAAGATATIILAILIYIML